MLLNIYYKVVINHLKQKRVNNEMPKSGIQFVKVKMSTKNNIKEKIMEHTNNKLNKKENY